MVCVEAALDGLPGGGGDAGGGGGVIGCRLTIARRIGDPVSAATTRPRMIAVPTGSGRRTVSRGVCPWIGVSCPGRAAIVDAAMAAITNRRTKPPRLRPTNVRRFDTSFGLKI
jgi:hypothetical protein